MTSWPRNKNLNTRNRIMSVLVKLNEARKLFHASKLEKTGHNKFAGYKYFELADFLIPALKIFESLKLSAVVSFGVDLASMTLTDLEDGSQFVITSPMSTAQLKACHEVQNLGAVQTYLRRYLWVAALEIVEHDAIDSSDGVDETAARKADPARAKWLADWLAAIDAAANVGELKKVMANAQAAAKKAGDTDAEAQFLAAQATKIAKAKKAAA